MKKKSSRLGSVVLCLCLALVCLIAGIALVLLPALLPDAFPRYDIWAYASIAPFAVSLILLIASFILLKKGLKEQKKESEEFLEELKKAEEGEKGVLSEDSFYYGEAARHINESVLLQPYQKQPFGVYEGREYDDLILNNLRNEISVSAGVAYFAFNIEPKLVRSGPREALLVMLKENFGKNVYYGRLQNGIMVFVPVLSSREEFKGKARRCVQLYSYTDGDLHIGVKAGVAFYPDFTPENLTSASLKETMNLDLLQSIEQDSEVPHRGYASADIDAYLLSLTKFRFALSKANSLEEGQKAFEDFLSKGTIYLSAESAGVLLYDETTRVYELLQEAGEKGFALLSSEGKIAKTILEPFVEWSLKEKGIVICGDQVYIPTRLAKPLDAMGVFSLGCLAVYERGKLVGFVYVTSEKKNHFENCKELPSFLLALQEYLLFVHRYNEDKQEESHEDILMSTFEHYAYAVAKGTFTLSYVSGNLASSIPSAKVGETCHKVLYGRDKPCKNCPLWNDNVETMVPRLSSGVFAYRAVPSAKETLMILSPHQGDFSSSRIDALTGLLSDASLHEDLQNEILLKESDGTVLAFRIRNIDTIQRMFRLSAPDEAIKLASVALQSASLGRGLYRNGEAGFAYLLPYTPKDDAFRLAEKVSKVLSGRFPFLDKTTEFVLDFVLLRYPLEAETPFALDALLRVLYQKADASGRGRLFEVDRETGRLVDYVYYAKTRLEDALRAKKMPIRYNVYQELTGNNPAYLEAVMAVENEAGDPVEEKEILDLADSIGKKPQAYLSAANSVTRFLGSHKRELASSSIRGAILRLDESCLNEKFVNELDGLCGVNKASHRDLMLEVKEGDLQKEGVAEFLEAARKAKYRIGLGDYKGDLSVEELAPFDYVSFPAEEAYGRDKGAFLLALGSVREKGLNILVKGYNDDQERHYLGSLSFHYGTSRKEKMKKEEEVVELF